MEEAYRTGADITVLNEGARKSGIEDQRPARGLERWASAVALAQTKLAGAARGGPFDRAGTPSSRPLPDWQEQKAALDRTRAKAPRTRSAGSGAVQVGSDASRAQKGNGLGLRPNMAPLDRRGAAHLLRRMGHGAAPDAVTALVGLPAADAAAALMDAAESSPLMETPDWVGTMPPHQYASQESFAEYFELNGQWWQDLSDRMVRSHVERGLRGRLAMFWHDHFVTSFDAYFLTSFAWDYWSTLDRNGLGNFKDFVRTIGLTPAMLYYLDGYVNERRAPNENYARELLELFTMGPRDEAANPNYTEADIAEIARALTGWSVNWHQLSVSFFPFLHDDGDKTIMGRSGKFGHDEVVDILFEERAPQIARFICTKLYREFVADEPDPSIVAQLAGTFQSSGFEIEPVLRQLFASEHFHAPDVVGARIKSPVQLMTGAVIEMGVTLDNELEDGLYWGPAELAQWVLYPPNVAGWPGHREWVNTTTLPRRWDYVTWFIYHAEQQTDPRVRALATALHDPNVPEAPFHLAVALAEHMMPVPLEEMDIPDPGVDWGGDLVNNPLPAEIAAWPEYKQRLAKRLLVGLPWYEWVLARQEAPSLIRWYLFSLVRLPEYQLA